MGLSIREWRQCHRVLTQQTPARIEMPVNMNDIPASSAFMQVIHVLRNERQ